MSTKTPDPVAIAASALHSKWVAEGEVWPEDQAGKDTSVSDASAALKAVTDAGWRIVRTDEPDTFDPPADYVWTRDSDDPRDWDRSGVFYSDEDMPEGCVPLYRITEEWTP